MANARGITIELEYDAKSKLKLQAIAKHIEALVNELDAIDNEELYEEPNYSSEKHFQGCKRFLEVYKILLV